MRPVPVLLAFALAAAVAGCGTDDPSVTADQAGLPVVVTALRPLTEVVERIAGNDVVVIDLVAVGETAHELKPTGRQRDEVRDADLAIVLGKGFQPELERLAATRDGDTLDVLAALGLPDRPDGAPGPADPHVWLDPTIMGSIVTAIADAVARVAPDDADGIRARSQKIVEENVRLDALVTQGLASCERTIIASQHESFGWFAARYGFTVIGFDAPVPDDDPAPDPERLAAAEPMLDDGSVTTLFVDPLTPTSWLEVIADERGLDTEQLDPHEGMTLADSAARRKYRSILLEDLRVLQQQLDCTIE